MVPRPEHKSAAGAMTYAGSARRIWHLGRGTHPAIRWPLLVPLLAVAIALAWIVLTVWRILPGSDVGVAGQAPANLARLVDRRNRVTFDALGNSSDQSQ